MTLKVTQMPTGADVGEAVDLDAAKAMSRLVGGWCFAETSQDADPWSPEWKGDLPRYLLHEGSALGLNGPMRRFDQLDPA